MHQAREELRVRFKLTVLEICHSLGRHNGVSGVQCPTFNIVWFET